MSLLYHLAHAGNLSRVLQDFHSFKHRPKVLPRSPLLDRPFQWLPIASAVLSLTRKTQRRHLPAYGRETQLLEGKRKDKLTNRDNRFRGDP